MGSCPTRILPSLVPNLQVAAAEQGIVFFSCLSLLYWRSLVSVCKSDAPMMLNRLPCDVSFFLSVKTLPLNNLNNVPFSSIYERIGTEQFEVMAAGRKPISRDVQTEVLASVHMLPDGRSTVFNLDGKSSGWSQELVIQWYYATFSQRK